MKHTLCEDSPEWAFKEDSEGNRYALCWVL